MALKKKQKHKWRHNTAQEQVCVRPASLHRHRAACNYEEMIHPQEIASRYNYYFLILLRTRHVVEDLVSGRKRPLGWQRTRKYMLYDETSSRAPAPATVTAGWLPTRLHIAWEKSRVNQHACTQDALQHCAVKVTNHDIVYFRAQDHFRC